MSNIESLDLFIPNYLYCALWSSTNDEDEPLDSLYDFRTDISSEGVLRVIEDCTKFLTLAKPYLTNADLAFAGHDFWLTRNHHAAGFWDRPEMYDYNGEDFSYSFYRIKKILRIKQNSEYLTEIAQSFGEIELYVGGDGKLYFA